MKISEILKQDKVTLSFEVFPPKTSDAFASVEKAIAEIAQLKPDFMSVTYGAGGGTSAHTVQIASNVFHNYGVTPLAHLTCVSSTKEHVHRVLGKLKEHNIENILALRGDIPADGLDEAAIEYRHAADLIHDIKQHGDFLHRRRLLSGRPYGIHE